jgi:hypothetical protein
LDGEFLCDACIRARAEYMDGGPAPVVPGDKGAVSWERREPRKRRDEHHWLPILIGGELYFQRSPPCHVNGSPPRSDTGGHKTVSTTISEAEAQRRALAIGFEHMIRAEQAEAQAAALAERLAALEAAVAVKDAALEPWANFGGWLDRHDARLGTLTPDDAWVALAIPQYEIETSRTLTYGHARAARAALAGGGGAAVSRYIHERELARLLDENSRALTERIAALEAERDVVRRAWEAAEARIAALVIERETLTRQVRSLTSDLEAECLDPDRKLHGIPGLVYTPDPDGCDPRMMRIDDPQTGAMGFGKGLWDAAYDLYDTMRDRLTASQAHAARLAAALGPFADGWAQYERVHGAQEARRGVVVSDGDTVGEFTRGQGRAAAAVLAATPADSLARQQAERAVVEAARALETHRQEAKRQLEHAETLEFPSGKPRWVVNVERERALMLALSKALAALDAGEGRDG